MTTASGAPDAPRTLLGVRGLSKRFGGTKALGEVDLAVRAGEIHALLGENGAGKSTLIKVLAGIQAPDAGEVAGPRGALVPGAPLPGLAFVHQDLGLVGTMSVAENIALSAGFARRGGLIDWAATRDAAAAALAGMGLAITPDTLVGHLGAAEKSMVAIARTLAVEAEIIVLDEPTATLPSHDVERLHRSLRGLRERGLGIVYVTHRLDEVFQLADTVTVLRDGEVRHSGPVAGTTPDGLVAHILGRPMTALFPQVVAAGDETVLAVEDLRSKLAGPVSFTLRRGEVLGLVGLRNSGQDIVGRLIAGALPPRGGTVRLGGAALPPGDIAAAIAAGIGFISSKRVEESIAPALDLRENLFLDPRLAGFGIIGTTAEKAEAGTRLRRFGVRPPQPGRVIATLSGGNQQKVVVARWLALGRRVLILEEPTTGVDVGARAEIYRLLAEAVAAGLAVIVVSSDFEEVAGLCHRALVFGRGTVMAELAGAALSVGHIARIAGGQAA